VPDMWKRLTDPDILIYLDVSYQRSLQRQAMDWTEKEFNEQLRRLQHAKEHSDIFLNTDYLTPSEVLEKVLKYLQVDYH
jgi:thymidylate kinase